MCTHLQALFSTLKKRLTYRVKVVAIHYATPPPFVDNSLPEQTVQLYALRLGMATELECSILHGECI